MQLFLSNAPSVLKIRQLVIEELGLLLPTVALFRDQNDGTSSPIEGISEIKVPRSNSGGSLEIDLLAPRF